MMTPDWQGDAVNGIMVIMVNGHTVIKAGSILRTDYIMLLPIFRAIIIGILNTESLLSAMICINHRPLVIFGKSLFGKENDHPLNDNPFL